MSDPARLGSGRPPGASDPRDLLALPRACALALGTAAYLRGDLGPDDALDAALGTGHRHVEQLGEELFDWMTGIRRLPLPLLRPALPEPGRIAGLVGPPAAITAAIETGQALVVTAAGIPDHTLVPRTEVIGSEGAEGVIVRWERFTAAGSLAPSPGDSGARASFLAALREAAEGSERLDLVPEEPVAVSRLPEDWTAIAPPSHVGAQRRHLLTLASRTLLLTDAELAADDERPGVVGLAAIARRTTVLRDLRDAARAALVEVVTAAADPHA